MLPGYGLRIHEIVIPFCTPAKHYVHGIPTTSRKYKQLGKLRTREPISLKLPAALICPRYRFSEKYRSVGKYRSSIEMLKKPVYVFKQPLGNDGSYSFGIELKLETVNCVDGEHK
ncbi:uncharacterized protein LOC117237549 [Bombus vosnesenskii]|uniref:Uncharacterized protein LOC117237549 n=1 Tax=Bombus vosnesenskii TaxID=207650 RepID=A0A6J3KZ72_9HYME|nr:uncharacterized protein LOC117237549 [Bombus vosnesenskii]